MTEQANYLYSAEQIRTGEQKICQELGIELSDLMERAGQALLTHIQMFYPEANKLGIYCGTGNNGGDGYALARLASSCGYTVTTIQVGDEVKIKGDAKLARDRWLETCSGASNPAESTVEESDLIVDALLGTGFSGDVSCNFKNAITEINAHTAPVVSADLPSGLIADTGQVTSVCVQATTTVSFVGYKKGLFTGQARDYTGHVVLADLQVSAQLSKVSPSNTTLFPKNHTAQNFISRKKTAHKGNNGRVLCLGGDRGMFGAIRLTSEACARVGAGLTRVVTHPDNVSSIISARPELMVFDWRGNSNEINDHLEWCDVIAIGPGMGGTSWGRSLVGYSRTVEKAIVQDADALTLLAKTPDFNSRRVITPHPGEAARLLNCSTEEVEKDRFAAAKLLQLKYGGVVVLKGAGTIVYDGDFYTVCGAGNPGMATGGMGDVLTGIIAGLIAQGYTNAEAARMGVWLHSTAADRCAEAEGTVGMLACDLFPHVRRLINGR